MGGAPDANYTGFNTLNGLQAQAIPSPEVIYEGSEVRKTIPMGGDSGKVTITESYVVEVPVERMYAKLMIKVNINLTDNSESEKPSIYNIDVSSIPWYCKVESVWTEDASEKSVDVYPDDTQFVSRAFTATESDADGYYIMYVPESIHGVVDGSEEKTGANAPSKSLVINVDLKYTDVQGGTSVYPYSFYPGGNSTDNFNIKRNCVYYVNITINELSATLIPSANCIVCVSGQTTSFYPYYRPEEGGGYKFIDYLNYVYGTTDIDGNAAESDETKRIDHVDIIWQSENSAGSGGYIGDNRKGKLVWIDDAPDEALDDELKTDREYWRKIYVKIPSEEIGNALIGAYNSDGILIWSWHIWSRSDDPSNVSNGMLYYTYEWDTDGIHNNARVPAYTVMKCNLGALANTPTTDDGTETFGTLYQWGRKDPFPAITTIQQAANNYNKYTVGNYYGNDGEIIVGMTEATDKGELFHSVDGDNRVDEIGTTFDAYIGYSILHPTVFICGTKEAGISVSWASDDYINDKDNYAEPYQDGNWIYDSGGDHYNCLWGGLDPEHDDISKSYQIGTDNYSNAVHMYDDYGEDKSIFDPCPYGWRVSPPDLWLEFTSTGLNPTSMNEVNYQNYTNNGFYMYMQEWGTGTTSFFPCQGTRDPDGSSYRVGWCGNYHNATADTNDRVNILHLHNASNLFMIFEFTHLQYYVKSVAGPVRCIRPDSVN